ncbi:hypothetical protein WKV44_08080 [Spirochaetia bacterium 38H-sp]|uniref:HEAT repeat domain-containing protein n=1 Tax=Rarispira pelagica TaxID=3141764 RepID=A0ABU9UCV3_9SPIR
MKKFGILMSVLFLVLGALSVFSQETASESQELTFYRQNFEKATLPTKVQIITNALELDRNDFGPLYGDALTYVYNHQEDLLTDGQLNRLAILAIDGAKKTAYAPSARIIWELFLLVDKTEFRLSAADALSAVLKEKDPVLESVHAWLDEQNTGKYASDVERNRQEIEAVVIMLGKVGDPDSFKPLLDTLLAQYSLSTNDLVIKAMFSLNTDVVEQIGLAIEKERLETKKLIYKFFIESDVLSTEQKTQVAVKSLDVAVKNTRTNPADVKKISMWRYEIASFLVQNPPSFDYAKTAVDHFNLTVLEYDRGIATRNSLAEAIAILGSSDSDLAADRLIKYLDLINTYTERSVHYDTQLTLATIDALKRLGRKKAYNSLLYVTFLNYPANIRNAARDAMSALKE